jgi:acyl-CoA synthetase (AMP-forming)/AMP-acid ligase II
VLSHPGVKECAVIGIPSERWGESPLVIAVKGDNALAEDDVLKHCDGKLARYKLPKAAVFVDAIPRNPSGKALKFSCASSFRGPRGSNTIGTEF